MSALALAAPKLVKLIPLLGSDKPGEVIATASAIGRTLIGAGCDWHDLADVVERAALPVVVEQSCQEASPAPVLQPWQLTAMDCLRAGAGRLKLDAIATALGLEVGT